MDDDDDAGEKECRSTSPAIPELGMVFQSVDEAYHFYNQYAKSIGFSARKSHATVLDDGTILRRFINCSKLGPYKSGCRARIVVMNAGGQFYLTDFEEKHNHQLVAPSEQRKIEDSQRETMRNMYDAGMGAADIYSSMCKTFGGAQHLSFTKIDCVNYLQKFKSEDDVKNSGCKRNSMLVDSHSQLSSDYNPGNSMMSDDPGTSKITDCHQASTSQCNDLAHLALTIVAKGNSSEDSVVFTRRLLTKVLEELDYFLKSDYDKARQLINIRDMSHEIVREGNNCSDEVDASVRLRDLQSKANVGVIGNTNGKIEKGKGKRKIQKISKGSCDRASSAVIGKTRLLLQDSSTPPEHHDNQVCFRHDLFFTWFGK
ncbi:hypothetical protein ACHQM5_026857 [Ranunculus cassubicifolius]